GVLDATSVVIAVGRHAERPLEGPAEMIRAQPNAVRERGERYLLCDMFFDVRGDDPLLPGGETAARRRFDAARTSVAAEQHARPPRPLPITLPSLTAVPHSALSAKNTRGAKGAPGGPAPGSMGILAGSK